MKKHVLVALKEELAGYTEEQWKELDEKTKKQYIKDHPNSKYAQQDKPAENKKSAMDLAIEEEENPMTTEEAKEYWDKQHNSDPILREYTSYEDWYKESKENGYISDDKPGSNNWTDVYNVFENAPLEELQNLKTREDAENFMKKNSLDPKDKNVKKAIDKFMEEPDLEEEDSESDWTSEEPMTTEEAKEYWNKHHTDDPILEEYNSFEEWYKESKENGYIVDSKTLVKAADESRSVTKTKKFVGIWNPKEFHTNEPYRYINGDSISTDAGYSDEDINKIERLKIGEAWISNDYGFDHIIVRAK